MYNQLLNYDESPVRQRKRADIINQSMDMFIRDGIHPLHMKEIAKECGISLRSLYYYYQSKEDLAVDIQIIAFNSITSELFSGINLNQPGYLVIQDIIDHLKELFKVKQKQIKYVTAFDYHFHNEYPNGKYNSFLNVMHEKVNSDLKGGNFLFDGTIETFNFDINDYLPTIFQSMFAYAQKTIYREKAMLSEDTPNMGDLDLYAEIIKNSVQKR